jgi:hypothetical protein
LIYQLGYTDETPVAEAVSASARWLADNPPTPEVVAALGDPFDYAAEDRLIQEWERCVARLQDLATLADPGFVSRYDPSFDRARARASRLNQPNFHI